MRTLGIEPDGAQYSKVMLAFAKAKKPEKVFELWDEIERKKIVKNAIIYNSLIMAYCKSNQALNAEKVL